MALNERERIHHQLLDALYTARKQVECLEAALAHSAAYLGTGVEREGHFGIKPEDMVAPDALIRYLELVEPERDISDYIGTEGVEHTRPRLGPDAPDFIRPNRDNPVNPLVRFLAQGHPDDRLAFPFKAGSLPPGTYISTRSEDDAPEDDKPQTAAQAAPLPTAPSGKTGNKAEHPQAERQVKKAPPSQKPAPVPSPQQLPTPSLLVENVPTPQQAARGAPGPGESPDGLASPQPRPLTDEDCLRAYYAMQALNYGIWDWNLRTGTVFLSTRWEDIMGRPPAGLTSALDTLTFNMPPDDAGRLRQEISRLHKGPDSRLSLRVRYGKEETGFSTGTVYAMCQRTGKEAVRLTVVLADDAEGPETSAGLVKTIARSAFFENMEEGFALFERRGHTPDGDAFALLAANSSFRKIYELAEEGGTQPLLDDVTGDDAEQWRKCLAKTLSGERAVRVPLAGGVESGFYEVSAFSPAPDQVCCIVKNVTEPHRVEQEIRLNEARLAALYRLSHMDAASEDKVARYCLREAVRLTGSELGYLYIAPRHDAEEGRIYWSHEALARSGKEPASPKFCSDAWSDQPECLLLKGPEVVNALENIMASAFGGAVAVNRYMLIPIMEDARVVCVAAVANKQGNYEASDQRQLELFINGMWFHLRRRWAVEDLQKAKDLAEAASRAKNEFLANISHELRTPLNGILGMLQVLQQSPLNKEQMECVTTANFSGRSLLRVISDILDFSRIEAGRLELAPQLFDFASSVRSTLGMFIHEAEKKGITFSLYLSKNIPSTLMGDESRVRQILFNLVSNAFKFTSQGTITVECELLAYRRKGKRCIYLAVHDTGIGIPDDKLGDIFQAFTQLDGSSTRRYSGAGLGLSIVRRLAQLMDGTVTVDSTPGKGTSVYCTLTFDDPPVIESLPEPDLPKGLASRPLDLLLVEDDPVNQFTLRTLLRKAGHPSVCVVNGLQAIEALLLHPFECIVTDIQMPVMDGVELTRRIREGRTGDIEPGDEVKKLLGITPDASMQRQNIPLDLPIVVLTAHAMAGDKERFLDMGVNFYLSKPIIASQLEFILARISLLVESQKNHATH